MSESTAAALRKAKPGGLVNPGAVGPNTLFSSHVGTSFNQQGVTPEIPVQPHDPEGMKKRHEQILKTIQDAEAEMAQVNAMPPPEIPQGNSWLRRADRAMNRDLNEKRRMDWLALKSKMLNQYNEALPQLYQEARLLEENIMKDPFQEAAQKKLGEESIERAFRISEEDRRGQIAQSLVKAGLLDPRQAPAFQYDTQHLDPKDPASVVSKWAEIGAKHGGQDGARLATALQEAGANATEISLAEMARRSAIEEATAKHQREIEQKGAPTYSDSQDGGTGLSVEDNRLRTAALAEYDRLVKLHRTGELQETSLGTISGESKTIKNPIWEKGWDERRARAAAATAVGRKRLEALFPNWVTAGDMAPESGLGGETKAEPSAAPAGKDQTGLSSTAARARLNKRKKGKAGGASQ